MTAQDDRSPASAEGPEPTQVLSSAPEGAPTVHLGPAAPDGRAPSDRPASAGAEYSATVLASHWIQRPVPDETLVEETSTTIRSSSPDRVDGTVLRFGPGVTAATAFSHGAHRTVPVLSPPPMVPRRRPRRHALPMLVVLCVLAFLAWQRSGPALAVSAVAVTARPAALGCDDTADLVGLVATNGRPGTFSYRWIRSDGTASGVLREEMVRGQRDARLHLLWTFQGEGHRTARAELRILSPAQRPVTTSLTYDCS
ncbi:hypothetical protein ABZT34_33215 [Streptomyces sp. NPDC005329]|uniref:hypothetical protein n=1 Tax=Streptomyces sp. NPDC005329 TaxID=3157034 RepID=UPI0033A5F27B